MGIYCPIWNANIGLSFNVTKINLRFFKLKFDFKTIMRTGQNPCKAIAYP
jgi:hypothetical protein